MLSLNHSISVHCNTSWFVTLPCHMVFIINRCATCWSQEISLTCCSIRNVHVPWYMNTTLAGEPPKASKEKEFSHLMKKVVFVLSGFQNPERGKIRDRAMEMGASYKADWGRGCTHLMYVPSLICIMLVWVSVLAKTFWNINLTLCRNLCVICMLTAVPLRTHQSITK